MVFELGVGRMPLAEIAEAVGAKGVTSREVPKRIVTDSREVREGDLFCALRGSTDGHRYIPEAKKNGAAAVLCEEKADVSLPMLTVPSTVNALWAWASAAREAHCRCRYAAITGSVGKTTTKCVIAETLRQDLKVFASEGNYNNGLGVPLSMLSVPKDTEIAILELGSNAMGEIVNLAKLVSPTDGIITAIGHAHIGAFGSLEGTAREKLGLLDGLRGGGNLFLKEGDPYLAEVKSSRHSVIYVKEASEVSDPAMRNALGFAAAFGKAVGLPPLQLKEGLCRAAQTEVRRRIYRYGDICVIDDSYNASPEAMTAAFAFLKACEGRRKILVLGDMLELGAASEELHKEVGANAAFADLIYLFGQNTNDYRSGMRGASAAVLPPYATHEVWADAIFRTLRAGDTVLIKASHGLHGERLTAALCKRLSQKTEQ